MLGKPHLIANPGDEPLAVDLSRGEWRTPRWTGDHEPAKLPVFFAPDSQPSRVLDPDQWWSGLGLRESRPLRFLWQWRRSRLLVLPDGLMEF